MGLNPPMTQFETPPLAPGENRGKDASLVWPVLAIAVVVALQIELVFDKSINWDEYFHFSQIHQHLRGEKVQWLQTPHVWLFGWVPGLSGSTIGDIQLTRLLMLPFELLAAWVIHDSARRMAGREVALACTLAWLTGGYVLTNSLSLRTDMIATGLLMAALWIALWRPLKLLELATIVVLSALAFVATIKSALYAPAFLGVALIRRHELELWAKDKARIGWALAAALAVLAVAFLASGLGSDLTRLALNSVTWMFSAGLFPQWGYLVTQLRLGAVLGLLIVAAPFVLAMQRRQVPARGLAWMLVPLFSIAVYRNAYPYFFPFILAPAMIALVPVVQLVLRSIGLKLLTVLLLLNGVVVSLGEDRGAMQRQREVQAGISEIFPTPVRYIDDVAFVSDFPRATPRFASGWSLAGYRKDGRPIYRLAIERAPTPFLLRQGYALELIDPAADDERALLPEDARALAENYVQHWGAVYVAGKRVAANSDVRELEILAPGPYTVEGATIAIDGRSLSPGEIVTLARGRHEVVPPRQGVAVLRYGVHLPRPARPWPKEPVFTWY